MIHLSHLLADAGVDLERTLVMRHRPTEPALRQALSVYAAEFPDKYNAYQRSQKPRQEKMLTRAKRLVSFLGVTPKEALFIGVYEVKGFRAISDDEYWAIPENQEFRQLGSSIRTSTFWFDLRLMSALKEWSGKLVVGWPGLERAWVRWAEGNIFPVRAMFPESVLAKPAPPWRELAVDWSRLQLLPKMWREQLAQWRGVYLIRDTSDGKCYVGSAYGEQNILGRWLNYAAKGDGGNVKLRERDPIKFVFSILERVSPDAPMEDVVALEATWKTRLDTRKTGLNIN